MYDCPFCNKKVMSEYNLFETENFVVKIGFAIIAPGQVMIIPKKHFSCFGELPDELDKEFHELKDNVFKAVSEHFHEPFIVEYGLGWQSVHHAHVHFIPLKGPGYEIKSVYDEMINKANNASFVKADWKKLKDIFKEHKHYVILESNGEIFVGHVPPTGTEENEAIRHRQFFSNIKGLKGISTWFNMSDEDKKLDEEKRSITLREMTKALKE